MTKKQLVALALAGIMTMSCIPCSWAEETPPEQAQSAAMQDEQSGPDGGAVAAAVVSDFFFIPGKVGTCVLSGGLWTVMMALTGGTMYRTAGDLVHGACTGKWVLTGEDFMGDKE